MQNNLYVTPWESHNPQVKNCCSWVVIGDYELTVWVPELRTSGRKALNSWTISLASWGLFLVPSIRNTLGQVFPYSFSSCVQSVFKCYLLGKVLVSSWCYLILSCFLVSMQHNPISMCYGLPISSYCRSSWFPWQLVSLSEIVNYCLHSSTRS